MKKADAATFSADGLEVGVGEWLAEGRGRSASGEIVLQVYRAELLGGALHLVTLQVRFCDVRGRCGPGFR